MNNEQDTLVDYSKCKIINIHRGKRSEGRDLIIYATLVDEDGHLVISARLDYIVSALHERLSKES